MARRTALEANLDICSVLKERCISRVASSVQSEVLTSLSGPVKESANLRLTEDVNDRDEIKHGFLRDDNENLVESGLNILG